MEKSTVVLPGWSHPLRMPASLRLTHTEPPYLPAGGKSSWRIPFILNRPVPVDGILKLQISGGRNNKGEFALQCTEPHAPGYLEARLPDGEILEIRADSRKGTFQIRPPASGFAMGDRITVAVGEQGPGTEVGTFRLLNKLFILYLEPADGEKTGCPSWDSFNVWGEGNQSRIIAVCTTHILGENPARIRAYVPGTVRPGESFPLLVRPEDEFGNLCCRELRRLDVSDGKTRIEAAFEKVPDSTCVRAHISLAGKGIFRFTVRETGSGLETVSNPLVCGAARIPVYWGMIHGHTEMSDGTGTLEQYFHQLKNETLLDFAAPGDHDHRWETSDAFWKTTCDAVKQWHQPGEFVTFPGYEWAKWRKNGDGDRNVYYCEDDPPLFRSDNEEYPDPSALFRVLHAQKKRALIIPHHTGHSGNFCDWKDHDPDFERLVEIFQVRGSYECSREDGNTAPESTAFAPSYENGYVRKALELGWRVGFTAGGDDHDGQWGTEHLFQWDDVAYKQGLMSIEAAAKTREAVFTAMMNRRTVATTGARMLLSYELNGHPMGSELNLGEDPELRESRRLRIGFCGTNPVKKIDIIRNNRIIHAFPGRKRTDITVEWEDKSDIAAAWLPPAEFCAHPFLFYYVRVTQADGEIAWASPVWIDP